MNLSEAADLGDRDMPQQADLDANPVDQEIAQLQSELAETQARLLRVSADYQNYIRRTQQNLAEAREQQRRDMAKAAIPVMDHFDLALTVDADKTSAADLLKGVQMVRDELLKALEQFGLRRLDVRAGEPFNPEHHQAVLRQQTPGVAGNHVAAMLQPGYTLDDRPLRPAKVIVAE